MDTIELDVIVTKDGDLTAKAPPGFGPGKHRVMMSRMDAASQSPSDDENTLDLPVIDLGPWPENLSLRREDMYGDWGR